MAARLDAYNAYEYRPLYRWGSCFGGNSGTVDQACLALAPGKKNVLLWGDSFAAQYAYGLRKTIDPQAVNLLQATEPACMPTLSVSAQGVASCRNLAAQMETYLRDHKPDLVILSADWLEYSRPPRFPSMISDLRKTIQLLTTSGIHSVLLGPSIQFRTRLPSMLARAHLRGIDPHPDDLLLRDIFVADHAMKSALPEIEGFSFVSVIDHACPQRQCPLMIGDVPLSWDYAHLTAEGSAYVIESLIPALAVGD